MASPSVHGTAQEAGARQRRRPSRRAASSSRAESEREEQRHVDHQVGQQPPYSVNIIHSQFERAATCSTTRNGVRPITLTQSDIGDIAPSGVFSIPSTSGTATTTRHKVGGTPSGGSRGNH